MEQKIAFVSYEDGHIDIYIMNADGSGQTNITKHQGSSLDPAWSLDGRKIVFVTNRVLPNEIYVMDADGGHQTQLTFTRTREDYPRWQP